MSVEPVATNRAGTISQAIRGAAALWPDKTWLDFSGDRWTFAKVDDASQRMAHGLKALGVDRGDRVCSILDNHADAMLVWLALAKLGAVSVPINTAYRGEFLRHQITDSGAALIIAEADYADRIFAIEASISEVRRVLLRGASPLPPSRLEIAPLETAFSSNSSAIDIDIDPSDLAMLLYTSGTTGPSKGCMISNNYICNMGWQSGRFIGVRHEDVYWTPCPLFHLGAAGGTIGTAQVGATMSIYPRFSLSRFWPEIERSRATVVMLLSSMLNFVADAPDTDESKRCFGQIRTIHGVPFGASLRSRWKERFGVRFAGAVGYGMTEACSITLTDLEQPNPADASGRRFEDFDVQIVDEKDRLLGPGQAGEVVVRPLSPNIMFDGYWRRPESTLEANRNLWFHTGDIGRIDANGFFYFVDRKKDYLRRGGENISSYEMEVAFRTHPDIQDVAVHAVSSSAAEDEIKVTAILCAGASVSPEALCRWSMEHLPIFAVPRYVEFRTDFPRNGVGRILKYELRNEGVTSATWDRDKSRLALRKR